MNDGLSEWNERRAIGAEYGRSRRKVRRPGRPSKADLAAEDDALKRLAVRMVLADHGHLALAEAEEARADYRKALGAFPDSPGRSLADIGDPRSFDDIKPSRTLRE